MTDGRDRKLQSAYRALGAEEPPRALDDAILAAARRPPRGWTQRWSVPLSLAAVVVLSVVVTLRIQHEQPGIEQPAPAREEAQVAKAPAPKASDTAATPPPAAPAQARKDASVARPEPRPAASPPAAPQPFPSAAQDKVAEPAVASAPASGIASAEGSLSRGDAAAARSMESRSGPSPARLMAAKPALAETPEQELERIAKLRAEGRHEEADKALAEFRKRLPDYRIPEAVLLRVERR